jgi:hypothetical protein
LSVPFVNYAQFIKDLLLINLTIGQSYTIKVIAKDMSQNQDVETMSFTAQNGVRIIPLSTETAKIDGYGRTWLIRGSEASFKFKTSQPVTSCLVLPSGVSYSQVEVQQQGSEYTFDFSLGDTLSAIELVMLCNYTFDEQLFSTQRKVIVSKLQSIPDYVLTSSNGFSFNEEPFTTELTITSVGAYKPITCEVSYPGEPVNVITTDLGQVFKIPLDLSGRSGEIPLTLVCTDELGMKGPTKTYTFTIVRDALLEVKNIWLVRNGKNYPVTSTGVYLPSEGLYSFAVELNKKGVTLSEVACSVTAELSGQSAVSRVISFVKKVFGVNTRTLEPVENSYFMSISDSLSVYRESTLKLTCSDAHTQEFSQEIDVTIGNPLITVSGSVKP